MRGKRLPDFLHITGAHSQALIGCDAAQSIMPYFLSFEEQRWRLQTSHSSRMSTVLEHILRGLHRCQVPFEHASSRTLTSPIARRGYVRSIREISRASFRRRMWNERMAMSVKTLVDLKKHQRHAMPPSQVQIGHYCKEMVLLTLERVTTTSVDVRMLADLLAIGSYVFRHRDVSSAPHAAIDPPYLCCIESLPSALCLSDESFASSVEKPPMILLKLWPTMLIFAVRTLKVACDVMVEQKVRRVSPPDPVTPLTDFRRQP